MVVVLDDHQHIAALDLLFGRERIAAYALVIAVGAFVRAGNDDRLVAAVTVVTLLQALHKLATADRAEVVVR